MSGIVGIYYLDGRPVDPMDVQRMVDSIAHRGPDGSGVWTDGSVGFGHRMLWTTPESLHEKLPLTNKRGDLTITADARIDNRDELFSTLNFNGRPRETITDSELILAAYEKWGEKCPEKLLGDFSFAIWDKRKQTIFCARDHMGVKPFYYYCSNKVFVFASEIKALLSLPEVPRRLNDLMVAYYLISMFEDKTITFYQDIFRLPPAHVIRVGSNGAKPVQYWALDPSRELKLSSNEEYAEAFRNIFTEAVRCRLRSAFPIGSMLSGGLDSSSVVCVARNLLSRNGSGRLHTFSAIFEGVPECDERTYMNSVLALGDLEPHYVKADRISPFFDIDRVLYYQDEPVDLPNLFIHWNLYHMAKKHGIRILLDGIDGDTTVSYSLIHLSELARKCRWISFYKEIDGLSKQLTRSLWKGLWQFGIKALIPEPIKNARRALLRWNHQIWNNKTILQTRFIQRLGISKQQQDLKLVRKSRVDHYYRLSNGLNANILEIINKTAHAFSLEARHPFFDRRLIEFCLGIPPEQKLYRGWTRIIMRRAMSNILPPEIQWRPRKTDFYPNFKRSLLSERKLVEEVILNNPKYIENYIKLTSLDEIYQRFLLKGTIDDGETIWKSAVMSLWLQRIRATA